MLPPLHSRKHDRPGRILERGLFGRVHMRQSRGRRRRCHHHGERFCAAALELTQAYNGRLVCRVDKQLVAAQPAYGDDLSSQQLVYNNLHRLGSKEPAAATSLFAPHARPTHWARHHLRVKSPVARSFVFMATINA